MRICMKFDILSALELDFEDHACIHRSMVIKKWVQSERSSRLIGSRKEEPID